MTIEFEIPFLSKPNPAGRSRRSAQILSEPPRAFRPQLYLLLGPMLGLLLGAGAQADEPCALESSTARDPMPLPVASELRQLTRALAFPTSAEVGSMDGLFLFNVSLGTSMEGEPLELRLRRYAESSEADELRTRRFQLIRRLAGELADGKNADEMTGLDLQERLLLFSAVSGTLNEASIRRLRARMGFDAVPGSPITLFRERASGELFGQIGGALLKFGFLTDERARSAASRIVAHQNTDAAASVWNPRTADWLAARTEGREIAAAAQVTLQLGRTNAPARDLIAGLGDVRTWRTDAGNGRTLEGVLAPSQVLLEGRRAMNSPLNPPLTSMTLPAGILQSQPPQDSQVSQPVPESKAEDTLWQSRSDKLTQEALNSRDPESLKRVAREKGWKPLAENLRRDVSTYLRDQGLFLRDFKARTSDFPAQFSAPLQVSDTDPPNAGRSDFGPMVTRVRDTTIRVSQALPSTNSNREVSSYVKLDPFKGTSTAACVTDDFNRGQERFSTCTEFNRDYGGNRVTRLRVDSTSVRARESLDLRLGAAAELRREDSDARKYSTRSAILHASMNAFHRDTPGPIRLFSNFIWDYPVTQGQSKAILRQEIGARSCDRQHTCLEIGLRHQAGSPLMETDPVTQAERPARSLYLTYSRAIF